MSSPRTLCALLIATLANACGPADAPPVSVAETSQPVSVNFYKFPAQKSASDPGSWGTVLLDIERHLPAQYGKTYQDSNKETHAHETSHGIHAHLRNYHNNTGKKANAFYLLQDRAFITPEPKIKKSHAAKFIPPALRGFRYSTYVTGQSAWDNEPLYLFDEWVAYVNGGKVGIHRHKSGLYKTQGGWKTGVVDGALEFTGYGIGLVMAIEQGDHGYLPGHPQFRQFFAWLLVEAMDTYRTGNQIPAFQMSSQQAMYSKLNGPEGASLRAFVKKLYGQAFSDRVFKGTKLPPPPKPDKGAPPPASDGGARPKPKPPAPDAGAGPKPPKKKPPAGSPDAGAGLPPEQFSSLQSGCAAGAANARSSWFLPLFVLILLRRRITRR